MAFSKDPEAYTAGEHQVLIEATTELVEVPCPNTKTAMHIRHRLYALRRAAIDTYDKALMMKSAGKESGHLLTPLVKCATALRGVTIGLGTDKKTLRIGRGGATTNVEDILTDALRAAGKVVRSEVEAKEVEAFGKIDFGQEKKKDEPVIPGYTLKEIIGDKAQVTGSLSDEALIEKYKSGELLTPEEMHRMQGMKPAKE